MISRLRLLTASPAARIAAGLALGQLLVYGTTPFISRLYTPAQVGEASIFLAFATTLGGIATLRLEAQLPGATDEHARWLTATALRAMAIISAISGVGYGFRSGVLAGVLLAFTTWSVAAVALWTQWASRLHHMSGVASSKIAQGAGQSFSQVGLGAAGIKSLGMQLGFVLAYAASAVVQFISVRPRIPRGPATISSSQRQQSWRSARHLTAATLLNLATLNAPLLVLSHDFSKTDAGHYSIAQRLAVAPAGLLVAALTPPILSSASTLLRANMALWPLAARWIRLLMGPSLVLNALVLVIPQAWITAVLGPDWASVKLFLMALTPTMLGVIVLGPLSQLLGISGHSRVQLSWDFARFALIAVVAFAAIHGQISAEGTVTALSLTQLTFYFIYVGLLRSRLSDVSSSGEHRKEVLDEPSAPRRILPAPTSDTNDWPTTTVSSASLKTRAVTPLSVRRKVRGHRGAKSIPLPRNVQYVAGFAAALLGTANLAKSDVITRALTFSVYTLDITVLSIALTVLCLLLSIPFRAGATRGGAVVTAFLVAFCPGLIIYGETSPWTVQKSALLAVLVPLCFFGARRLTAWPDALKSFLVCLGGIGALTSVLTLTMGVAESGRIVAAGQNPIAAARLSCLFGVFAFAYMLKNRGIRMVLGLAGAALGLYAGAMTGSRGPLLMAVIACLVILLVTGSHSRWGQRILIGLIAITSVAVLFANSSTGTLGRLVGDNGEMAGQQQSSDNARSALLSESLHIGLSHPFGIGVGNLWEHLSPLAFIPSQEKHQYPHNVVAEAWAEGGWIAAIALVALMVWAARRLWRVRHHTWGPTLIGLSIVGIGSALTSSDLTGNRLMWVLLGVCFTALASTSATASWAPPAPADSPEAEPQGEEPRKGRRSRHGSHRTRSTRHPKQSTRKVSSAKRSQRNRRRSRVPRRT